MRFCVCLLLLCCSAFATAEEKKVLVVHSYHQGFYWTDSFQRGLAQQLEQRDISMRVLYLDSKRNQSARFLNQLYSLYKTKLEQEHFDAIVVSDNIALALMQRLAEQLGDTPVIFGGINDYQPSLHAGLKATGLTEDTDILANIALIERLQPQVKQIYVVTDHSISGKALRVQIDRFLTEHPRYQHKVMHLVPDNMLDLAQQTAWMDMSDAVLFWAYYRDISGHLTSSDDWKKLNQMSRSPIYLVHDVGVGHGAVGGVIQSGYKQGFESGEILLNVLANPSAPLPKVRVGEPDIRLDYQAVARWGLGVEGESASVFFNKPEPFFERYSRELRMVGIAFVLLLGVILLQVSYLRRLRRSESLARESQLILESIFDQSLQYIGILDQHGCLISSNSQLQTLLFYPGMPLERPLWQHKHWEDESGARLASYFASSESMVSTFEAEIWSAEQGSIVLEVSLKPFSSQAKKAPRYLFEARDITSRKVMEDKLYKRESNLRNYYEQQPVMMVTLDANNRIQQVNRFAQQLLGYPQMSMLGHHLHEFYCDSKAMNPRQVLLQPDPDMKGVWRREIEYRHTNGDAVWVRENIRPLTESGQVLIVGEDISHNKQLATQLEYQAKYDLLTDTYNRNQFEIELKRSLGEVESHRRVHAMLYIDMDQLKVLNDTAGHDAGDAAIQYCASMLEEVLPHNAVLARLGGDEFAVLLKDSNEHTAIGVAKSILATLGAEPFVWETVRLNLTCSIGIRMIDHTADSPQMVHAQADTACHAAKELGRNRYQLFSLDSEELQRRQQEMESVNLVHDALANDRLELFAQRILPLSRECKKMHFEILVRIRDSDNRYLSPVIFMPASERYNIAHLIDEQVVNQTLDWLEARPEVVARLGRCSINLSGHSMGNPEFIQFLLDRLAHSVIPCESLCLEITETAAMKNVALAMEFFAQLKALGCLIALDDFGSGLSSFGYLRQLPLDIVKIDGMFVRDMHENETDLIMVRAINELAQQMKKQTVAEFVESPEIIDRLLELGVDYAQGYVIGKPKPLGELIEELLAELER
ncbi:EAL domain-containing protein [Vibrio cidicii]|uniref:EAL domain-containing protein n=1 Tax=Vibrio cidicii TaxID=1763883 RepID=UPI0018C25DB6|nr:EAL domain-containing protein [Vibrio cidicii]MBG0754710.1 GGDEF domain-containing protein [Vibrio cidicii]